MGLFKLEINEPRAFEPTEENREIAGKVCRFVRNLEVPIGTSAEEVIAQVEALHPKVHVKEIARSTGAYGEGQKFIMSVWIWDEIHARGIGVYIDWIETTIVF